MKKTVKKKIREIADAIDDNRLSIARGLIIKLEDEVGLFPDLQEYKSMLDRLEMLNDLW